MTDPKVEKQKPVPPFVQFCCAAIPQVFDDSLSYYEALCAMWKYLDETVKVINNNALVTEDFIAKVEELHDYVEHYFDNLDVQEEINNKLDEMATSGQLQQLIDTYFADVDEKIGTINLELNQRLDAQDTSINTLRTETNTRLASQDGDIQTLESRMDSFSSLTEGSTTGDAELIDGRTSFDGRTFSNIGDNIRNYQDAGYTDITATLTKVEDYYMPKNFVATASNSFDYYILESEKDKLYFIDCIALSSAPQVVYGNSTGALAYCIPEEVNPAIQYKEPIIIKGTGSKIYINNLKTNTSIYVGVMNSDLVPTDTDKYFTDITASCTLTEGKYRNKDGVETTGSYFNYYTISTPVIGKIYRIFTASSTNVPYAVQSNGDMCYPETPANIPLRTVPTYYDIYCTSSDSLYINVYPLAMLGSNVKIYESVFTYTTPLQQNIKSDVGAFDKAFFIGDSLTYGQTYTAASESYRNFYNYPYYLDKLLQFNEKTEVARSGATAQTWWNNYNDQINQNDCIYFIWLGTNDAYTDTVATDCAGDDYTQFAETATGYLGKIVGKVASLNNVKIVMLNNYVTVGVKATNNKVIQDIATKFGATVINVDLPAITNTGYHTAYNGYYNAVHFNNQGHNYVANIVANDLMSYMNANQGSFELYKAHE